MQKYITIKFVLLLITLSSIGNATTRIMPLGDSITYDQISGDERPTSIREGYRSHLWYALQSANFDANFVGSRSAGESVEPEFDTDNEGHPGWTSYEIAERISSYLELSRPETILLHIGTNDNSSSIRGVESILNEIDHYERNSDKRVLVLVALIIDRKVHDPVIGAFNKKLKSLIELRRASGDIITLVDMYNNAGLVSSNYTDSAHPNDSGYKKMSNVWFEAIQTPYKPFNTSLAAFPYTLVNASYIVSIDINEVEDSVTFETEIPDAGITF